MNKKLTINDRQIEYQLRKHRRVKRLRIAVYCDARVVVTKPWWITIKQIEKFMIEKGDWIIKRIDHFNNLSGDLRIKNTRKDYLENKDRALRLVVKKIEYFNKFYGFQYNKIFIKDQKTRWGSCSSKKNLNFNYRVVHLEETLLDYIVVHELCHLGEMNHSQDFWNLVQKNIPDYLELRRKLKNLL